MTQISPAVTRLATASLGTLLLIACNTSEPPRAETTPTPVQTPTQVVAATAPVTAAPAVAAPVASAEATGNSAAEPAKAGGDTPAAASNAPAAGSARGPAASNDTYTTWLETIGNYTAGQAGQVRLVLEAKAPYHTNEEYPYKFTFGAPVGGVSYPTPVVKDMKVSEMSASMSLPIQAAAKGAATVQGTFNFSVCSKDKCLIEKANLTLPIQIN
ncbi:MAG TPA: hypothetical protein VHO25_24290 [Polyangiaceae bacterium]|nr:hypothetical protein [Polyangiaceae bacterium]